MVNLKSYNIDGTLGFGIKLKKNFFIIVTICFTIATLTCLIPVILYFLSVVELLIEELYALICFFVLFLIADFIIMIVFIRQNIFFKITIKNYLNDPLLYKTESRIHEYGTKGIGWYKTFRLIIKFEYEGQEISIQGKKFCKQFKKYIGHNVDILYSPKYKEILFLSISTQ